VSFYLFVYGSFAHSFFLASKIQFFFESFYLFIYSLIYQQVGAFGNWVFSVFITIFAIIFLSNFFGLVPYSFTLTSSFFMTFSLAVFFNLSFFLYGIFIHQKKFFSLFVPSGVPKVLLPLLVVIEILSYLIRSFSLSLRLFANMMAGHSLLVILASFVVAFLGFFAILAIFPFFLVLFVFFF